MLLKLRSLLSVLYRPPHGLPRYLSMSIVPEILSMTSNKDNVSNVETLKLGAPSSISQVLRGHLLPENIPLISLPHSLDTISSYLDAFLFKNRPAPILILNLLRDMISSFDSCLIEEKEILLSLIFPKVVRFLNLNPLQKDLVCADLEKLLLKFSISICKHHQPCHVDSYSKSLPIFWLHLSSLTIAELPDPSNVDPNNLNDLFRLYMQTNKSVIFFEVIPKNLLFNNDKLLTTILESSLGEELIDSSHCPILLKCLKNVSDTDFTNQSDFVRIHPSSIPKQKALSSIFKGFIPLIPWTLKKIESTSPCFKILTQQPDGGVDPESLQSLLSIIKLLCLKSYSLSTETSKHVRGLALYYLLNSSPSNEIQNLLLDEDICTNLISSMIYFHDWQALQLYLQKIFAEHDFQGWSNQHIIFEFKNIIRKLQSIPRFVNECIPSYVLLREAISAKIGSPIDILQAQKFNRDVEHILALLKSILKLEEDPTVLDLRSNSSKLFPLLTEDQKWIIYNINYTDSLLDFLRKQFFKDFES